MQVGLKHNPPTMAIVSICVGEWESYSQRNILIAIAKLIEIQTPRPINSPPSVVIDAPSTVIARMPSAK
jgi:hypothetical protein